MSRSSSPNTVKIDPGLVFGDGQDAGMHLLDPTPFKIPTTRDRLILIVSGLAPGFDEVQFLLVGKD
jgi:hypothetical protein